MELHVATLTLSGLAIKFIILIGIRWGPYLLFESKLSENKKYI
jgi:hypothetical protein